MRSLGLAAAVVLLCTITLVPAFSEDGNDEKDSKFDFGGYSNSTLFYDGYSNRTMAFDSNKTDIGHEISDYVHKRNELEKTQRTEMLSLVKACREQAKESGKQGQMHQCLKALVMLKTQYQSFVSQQNSQFQQFRQDLVLYNHTAITPDQNSAINNTMHHLSHVHANGISGINHNMHKKNRHH